MSIDCLLTPLTELTDWVYTLNRFEYQTTNRDLSQLNRNNAT